MPPAAVRILHPTPADDAGELTRLLARAREAAAEDLARRFGGVGADDVRIVAGAADRRSFGERLRGVAADLGPGGLVVLGSGSIPLAADDDLRRLVATAAGDGGRAVTNNRYSSDVVAIRDASVLADLPDLPADNALPRWLEHRGVAVEELPDRWRLGLDLDSPLDLELVRRHPACPGPLARVARSMAGGLDRVAATLDELARRAADARAELLVAGRLSAATLRVLERGTACRVRALVEERGLRASWRFPDERRRAGVAGVEGEAEAEAALDGDRRVRPPASAIGLVLDRDGPAALGALVARLSDGAVLDSRVLLAHRHGADEAAWPSAEDRYASDLLLADRVRDPWLRDLTLAAWGHRDPIALGGHSLVGPGLPLALGIGTNARSPEGPIWS